jgi:hypothetical protein
MVTRSAARIEGAKRSMRMGFYINENKIFSPECVEANGAGAIFLP